MKHLITILLVVLLTVSIVSAGSQWKSESDQSWEITVIDCQGNTTIYKDCYIVSDDRNRNNALVFMPNQGKIPTGSGELIKVLRSGCTGIIMISK